MFSAPLQQNTRGWGSFQPSDSRLPPFCHSTPPANPFRSIASAHFPSPRGGGYPPLGLEPNVIPTEVEEPAFSSGPLLRALCASARSSPLLSSGCRLSTIDCQPATFPPFALSPRCPHPMHDAQPAPTTLQGDQLLLFALLTTHCSLLTTLCSLLTASPRPQ